MPKQNKHTFYCVQHGDSFFGVAKRVFGDERMAVTIQKLNPSLETLEVGKYLLLTAMCHSCNRPIPEGSRPFCICVCGGKMTVFPLRKVLYGNE